MDLTPVGGLLPSISLRSLVIKNYRIYRIFNSITVQSKSLQTRRLLKFLALLVFISLIPAIIQNSIRPPIPDMLDIGGYHWVECRSVGVNRWWFIVAACVPITLIIFGVFFSFQTRNIRFLWNEAREIAVVS